MTDDEHFATLVSGVNAVLRVDPAALDEPVPSCPGWTVADVIGHTTQVHRWATEIVATSATERLPFGREPLPEGEELIEHFAAGGFTLVDTLRGADLDKQVFTWAGPGTARWWLRRQANETALHAWDARSVGGNPHRISASAAVDAIDELFGVFVPHRFKSDQFAGTGETMHVHATDHEGEWLLRFDPEAVAVTREHGKGDVAVRGPAADLLLCLWNRAGTDGLDVFGERSVLDRFRDVAHF